MKKLATMLFLLVGMTINAQESVVTQNELPQEAQSFIKKHFSQYTLDYIILDKEYFSSDDYTVRFSEGLKIEFNEKGEWTEIDGNYTEIPTEFISKNITSYVKAKFANTRIVKIEKSFFGTQEVKLSNGLELEFDSKGNFKRVDD
ncbi:PepSY-like domain-containing protein [Capnocytophaga cynodegmi]|uniref:PepSY-like domain-containing protein n=1 Tax=Capnocytophaga cynodegmi TaxID=28189 RepID=UPI0037CD66FD